MKLSQHEVYLLKYKYIEYHSINFNLKFIIDEMQLSASNDS